MEDVQASFDKAVEYVKNNSGALKDKAGNDGMLDIYGCYKLAVEGKVNIKKPGGLFNNKEKAKWEAWNKWSQVEDLVEDQNKAKEKYHELVANIIPDSEW
jgi:acyl-CoA-binding protein